MTSQNRSQPLEDSADFSGAPLLPKSELESYVQSFLKARMNILGAADRFGSPLYLFDRNSLLARAREFKEAFTAFIPGLKIFYAMKSNNFPGLARELTQAGLGLDVSSGMELETALSLDNQNIIFSGPGKTRDELDFAAANAGQVTLLLDSFSELEQLERAAAFNKSRVRAGVRITSQEKGLWRKFGIRMDDLFEFTARAQSFRHVDLCGLQFHTSWNLDSSAQVEFIRRLGTHLSGFDAQTRSQLRFLDIGGGYWPAMGEWLQPVQPEQQISSRHIEAGQAPVHHRMSAQDINSFARDLSLALKKHIFPIMDCEIYTEPGRWLSNSAMHILLTVVDKKAEDMVITDGGINLVGWERFESDYAPLINLTRPSMEEKTCWIMGSLCTPHDLWGYSYFGQDIQPGDRLLVPDQGAYTYSLKQSFIKPVAPVVNI